MLSDAEVERYSRQILLPEVGGRGQERLRAAAVRVSMLDEPIVMRETAVLAALHLAVAGVGRIVPTGAAAEILRRDLDPLVRERVPGIVVAAAESVDLEIGFGTVPKASVPTLGVLMRDARIGILASETGARCEHCRDALVAALDSGDATARPALAPFLGALVATSAVGRLLGFGGPVRLAFDLARGMALESRIRVHECPAERRA